MKSLILILVAAALSVASVAVIAGNDDAVAAHSPQTETLWKCRACDHSAYLTAARVMELAKGPYNGGRPIDCPACGRCEAFLARQCRSCQGAYLGSEVEGGSPRCPACVTPGTNIVEPRPLEIDPKKVPVPSEPPAKVI